MHTSGNPTLWAIFAALVLVMLAADLGVVGKSDKAVSVREALVRSVWVDRPRRRVQRGDVRSSVGKQQGLEFTAGYLLEEALSVDNLFVFVVIFSAFRVPAAYQHRVLFWGIIGAVAAPRLFIGVGTALVQRFTWVMIVFGALLLYTAWKLFRGDEEDEGDIPRRTSRSASSGASSRPFPSFAATHFIVRESGKSLATPLLAVLVLVETSDVLFALDSIPAVFGVTKDPFIVYTSNIFAILGLRSMYFLLAAVVDKFVYLKTGSRSSSPSSAPRWSRTKWVHIPTASRSSIIAVRARHDDRYVAPLAPQAQGSGLSLACFEHAPIWLLSVLAVRSYGCAPHPAS